jgi:hypothetical protein
LNKPWYSHHTKIYSTAEAFTAFKADDGLIMAWGSSSSGGVGAPSGSDYTKIYSTEEVFKADGSITAGCTYASTIRTPPRRD